MVAIVDGRFEFTKRHLERFYAKRCCTKKNPSPVAMKTEMQQGLAGWQVEVGEQGCSAPHKVDEALTNWWGLGDAQGASTYSDATFRVFASR